MRALTGELLLAAWEAGAAGPEFRHPLALLAHGLPGLDPAALSALPLAARDLALLRLRGATFGPALAVYGRCPACGERLEFTLDAHELAAGLAAAAAAGPVEWAEDGRAWQLRPVTTDDLAAALAAAGPDEAQDLLLALCLKEVDQERVVPSRPSAPVPPSAVKRFEELHADAEIRCALECPACSARHLHDFDIARFLWREVAVAGRRLLADVHRLAAAYGWREQDILALSPRRRAAYLELAGA